MDRRGPRWLLIGGLATLLAWLVIACSLIPDASPSGPITVYAAASLRAVFDDLEDAWLVSHPDSDLILAYDGSNILATQIAQGAPADVFVSADLERPRQLVADDEAVGEVLPFAGNRVVLVAPSGDDSVTGPGDLARPGVRILGASEGVPITRYADKTLRRLAATMPDPRGFEAAVSANLVSREDNVRAALAKIELGEGDAAFVYATDLASSDRVREVPLPDGVAATAEYGMVQVSDRRLAGEFVTWLGAGEAADVLAAAGFSVSPR